MPADMSDRFYGLYRGYVLDNKDPDHQGRLKVALPDVYGNDSDSGSPLYSTWAYPKWAMAGMNWGFQMIPPVKNPDGSKVFVWVEFESGDQKKPVWSGCFVGPNGVYDPMHDVFGGKPHIACCLVTPRKNRIYIDDNDDKGVMEIVDRYEQCVRISSGPEPFIEVKDKFGNIIKLSEEGIKMNSPTLIELTAPSVIT